LPKKCAEILDELLPIPLDVIEGPCQALIFHNSVGCGTC
jgi:hypothetical protein